MHGQERGNDLNIHKGNMGVESIGVDIFTHIIVVGGVVPNNLVSSLYI